MALTFTAMGDKMEIIQMNSPASHTTLALKVLQSSESAIHLHTDLMRT